MQEELTPDGLLRLVGGVLANPQDSIAIECTSASTARQLRQRYYRLSHSLDDYNRRLFAYCRFIVSGRRVLVRASDEWIKLQPATPEKPQ